MGNIAFFDAETSPQDNKILDIGCVRDDESIFHRNSVPDFIGFIRNSGFIAGHNIFGHDLKYLSKAFTEAGIHPLGFIDTLLFSPLLFPSRPYHALLKDDKLQSGSLNNPLNDSKKARDLFFDEVAAFNNTDDYLKQLYYLLLGKHPHFTSFFDYLGYAPEQQDTEQLIRERFADRICSNADLSLMISRHPVELAYCLALINADNRYSITPPWVLRNFPGVERLMRLLRSKPCVTGCQYCNTFLDVRLGLKRFFGYDSFRLFGGQPLQERAAKAAVDNKSLLAVFPTGGGKSITFQLPALMNGEGSRGLTVVISPLQSLMKDQVDNLESSGITEAVTINGLLDPIERAKSFERVEDGSASILYISPESLRSRSIEHLLLGRKIVRFVIDEAHCFSSWGQDFRVDYLYIADFIRSVSRQKNLDEPIPVSCFTATAKQMVIEDIQAYFRDKLSLQLELFTSNVSRTNLHYNVFEKDNEEAKYQEVRALIERKDCPVIIYVSRTRRAYDLARRLSQDGLAALPYHGRMEIREKSANQDAFMQGQVRIMVATSAFGMGVDKKDVGMVIHYDISDSLENYVQEAGRAGRDESIVADCYVLYNEEDLSKHFILLNQNKLSIREIQQVWKAIKGITKFRTTVSNSALEIARRAGWDDRVREIETRVTTAIAALEEAGYLRRGQNMPRVYANSILSKTAEEAIQKIEASPLFNETQREDAKRIIRKLISSKSRSMAADEAAEARVDYISDHLGIPKQEVLYLISLLREEKILADTKDLRAYIRKSDNRNHPLSVLDQYVRLERFLLTQVREEEKVFNLKELNELAGRQEMPEVTTGRIRTVLNFWAVKNYIRKQPHEHSKNHLSVQGLHPEAYLNDKTERRHLLARFIVEFLHDRAMAATQKAQIQNDEVLVEFSEHELKDLFVNSIAGFGMKPDLPEVEDALFFLSKIDAIKIEGGFMVVYNALTIERLETDNKRRYRQEDYQKLNDFYENKVQQIHIVGEYARKMISDYQDALQFVDDYFHLNYASFLNRYFKGNRQQEIRRNITPAKFRQLFGDLSPAQIKIITDNNSAMVVVPAGPGSGKTRVLVHKLASLLLMEDVKHEQLLMLTFSRAAVTEFRKRLLALIGNAALFIEIKTFHSFCFDLLGRVGTLEKSDDILRTTIARIENNEVELSRITKTVLVIDEAQDINQDEFDLIRALQQQNEAMRIVAVGDDDQNIFEFRGSSSEYLKQFAAQPAAVVYELVENYRSKPNLVDFTNQFIRLLPGRLKTTPNMARQLVNGSLSVHHYSGTGLIIPLVKDILSTRIQGTAGVLVQTNEDALKIAGLLTASGMKARLIASNDEFSLYNLHEIRYFISKLATDEEQAIIRDETWEGAKRALKDKFRRSRFLAECECLLLDFEKTNPKLKYRSDFETYIRESKMEDFYRASGDTILVSTIHKAKGREFDQVFLMLKELNTASGAALRLAYVAMTRARHALRIHTGRGFPAHLQAEGLWHQSDEANWPEPDALLMHLGYKDVHLDYFIDRQSQIARLISGDPLLVNRSGCFNNRGEQLLRFSQSFLDRIAPLLEHYALQDASVYQIVHWQKNGSDREVCIVLPEVWLRRGEGNLPARISVDIG